MHIDHTNFSRRSFLGASAAALAGLALSRSSFAEDAAGGGDFGGLPIGVQSYTLRDRSFEKALDAIKNDLKLNYVEVWPGHLAGAAPTAVKALLEAHGIVATGYGVVGFSKNADANRKVFDQAKAMGIKHITCDPDPDSFDSLDKLTEEYGITADIHDHGPGHRWGKIDVIWDAIKDHSKGVGLCNDTGHFIRAGEDPLRACEVFKDRVHAMHVKDFKKEGKDWKDCGLGEGNLPLEKLMKWLLDNNFKGDLSLEYEGGNPVQVCQSDLEKIKKAVMAAKKA
jgi:inosose dehydratase